MSSIPLGTPWTCKCGVKGNLSRIQAEDLRIMNSARCPACLGEVSFRRKPL